MRFNWRHLLIILAVVSAIGTYAWFNFGAYPEVKKLWFFDLNTGKLFVGSAFTAPPIAAPSDSGTATSGVVAHVIRIEGEDEPRIVFLQSYTPEAQSRRNKILSKSKLSEADAAQMSQVAGTLLALPPQAGEKPQWMDATNAECISFPMRAVTLAKGRAFREDLP
jgi:hypothetical protein